MWQIQEQADGSYAVYNTYGGGTYLSYVPGIHGAWLAIAPYGAGLSTWQLAPVPVFSYTFTSAGATGAAGPSYAQTQAVSPSPGALLAWP